MTSVAGITVLKQDQLWAMVVLKVIICTSGAKSWRINCITIFYCASRSRCCFDTCMNESWHRNTFYPWIFQRTHINTVLIDIGRRIFRASFQRDMQVFNTYIVTNSTRILNFINISLCILLIECIENRCIHFNCISFYISHITVIGNINIFNLPFHTFICIPFCVSTIPDCFQPFRSSGVLYTD